MICPDCKNQLHEKCLGETWCDCQHRKDARVKVPHELGLSILDKGKTLNVDEMEELNDGS